MWPTATERLLDAKGLVPREGSCLLALVAHCQTCFCSILDVLPSDDFQGSSILSLIVDQSDSSQFMMQLMLMCRILSFQLQSC